MSADQIDGQLPLAALDLDGRREARRPGVVPAQTVGEQLSRRVLVDVGSADVIEELLLSVASGDPEALVALKNRMGGLVRVNVRRVLGDASRATEVTEAVFADVLQDAIEFDPGRHSAQAWLLMRAHHRAMEDLRSGPAVVGSAR